MVNLMKRIENPGSQSECLVKRRGVQHRDNMRVGNTSYSPARFSRFPILALWDSVPNYPSNFLTNLQPTQVMTDTNSYTDIVFGLFWLLGFQFSPRLADIKDLRFWRMERQADYGAFNDISKYKISSK